MLSSFSNFYSCCSPFTAFPRTFNSRGPGLPSEVWSKPKPLPCPQPLKALRAEGELCACLLEAESHGRLY